MESNINRATTNEEIFHIVDAVRDLVSTNAQIKDSTDDSRIIRLRDSLNQKVDILLGKLLDGFDGDVDGEQIRDLFDPSTGLPEDLTTDFLSKFNTGVVPVVVMRELLFKHRINMSYRQCPNWTRFTQRYLTHVIAV